MTTLLAQMATFYPITVIVEHSGADSEGFYESLSNDAPFSWGDNNRTLVTAQRVMNHMVERGMDEEYPEVYNTLASLPEGSYIDLEN